MIALLGKGRITAFETRGIPNDPDIMELRVLLIDLFQRLAFSLTLYEAVLVACNLPDEAIRQAGVALRRQKGAGLHDLL
jgi:hypothetical protein